MSSISDQPVIPYLSQPVICIVGPTASGKSEVAQVLAERIDGEIISADSMQVYRGMDIGTGKVPVHERRVPHYGLDITDPGEPFSVALFQDYARQLAEDIDSRGKRVILCGGTGLYVRGVIDDYQYPKGDQVENPYREAWTTYFEEHGTMALYQVLQELDPESAAVVHPNNVRRVIRALELHEAGESYARQKENLSALPEVVPSRWFGLAVDRDILNERIEARVDAMMESGLLDEVTSLLDKGLRGALTAPQAIGYKEFVSALDGECTIEEAVELVKQATRRYAKRQRSWFRKEDRIRWISADTYEPTRIVDAIVEQLSQEG